ncbi:MAG TPA: flagellar biosynthetic protein FliO [Clostridia bacterium]|nr:flagellar biosynthetic protein FliO [Clostridia bacterium]
MEGDLWTAVLRVIIFLPLVVLLAYWSIKFGASRGQLWQGSGSMRVVERLPLGPKTGLCIVRVGEEYYLIGISEAGVSLLKELPHYRETAQVGNGEWQNWRDSWTKWMNPRRKG